MEPLNTGIPTTEATAETTPGETTPGAPPSPSGGLGLRRTIATLLLATGLLAVGGVAAVSAASPTPSAPSAPSASSAPAAGGGTTAPAPHDGTHGDCPGM